MSSSPMLPQRRPLDFVARVYSDLTVVLLIPVSITIFAVVWGVENLTPLYANKDDSPLFLVAGEGGSNQAPSKKFEASIYNALMIIGMILAATVLIVVLYKLRCMKAIVAWLLLSAAMIFFFLFWVWIDLVCTKYQIPYDLVSVCIVLWNFGVVGILSVFYFAHPKMQQAYLVVLSVIMAWMLSRLPEWTTWAILIAVALYDICVVLCPNGPLKMLVEESKKRDEPIPGFVYDSTNADLAYESAAQAEAEKKKAEQAGETTDTQSKPADASVLVLPKKETDQPTNPLTENEAKTAADQKTASEKKTSGENQTTASPSNADAAETDASPEEEEEEEHDPFDAAHLASPFRLGLGDFIFYSVLVARAAYFSYVSWMTCYICVSMGLIGTLSSLLFLRGKVPALPALPISIFLGVIGFFLSRYVMVPFSYFVITTGTII